MLPQEQAHAVPIYHLAEVIAKKPFKEPFRNNLCNSDRSFTAPYAVLVFRMTMFSSTAYHLLKHLSSGDNNSHHNKGKSSPF